MKAQQPVLWISTRKNRRRKSFDVLWGHGYELNGWDLLMWQRVCQEFCVGKRLEDLFNYYIDQLPGNFELEGMTPAFEAGECRHVPEELVEMVRTILLEAQGVFLKCYYVGAHHG